MKKQKQEKSELDYLKKINNTLGGIYTVLVLLAIFITIAGVVSIAINNNVAAEAAEENLLRAPITVETINEDMEILSLDYSIGLELGKSYRVSGTYGVNNTIYNNVLECIDADGLITLLWQSENEGLFFYIYDKISMDENEEPAPNENSAMVVMNGTSEETIPFTINSITLVEKTSNGNLIQGNINVTREEGVIDLPYSFNFEAGKTYKISGTYGSSNTAFEITSQCEIIPEDGLGFADDRVVGMLVYIPDEQGAGIQLVDHITSSMEYADNNAVIMLAEIKNENVIPITINKITEYVDNPPIEAPQIIGNITNSFTGFLTGTGEGIVNFFEVVFTDGNGGISTLGIVGLTMMGLGLAVGIISVLMAKAKM